MGERVLIESLDDWTRGKCEQHIAIAKAAGLHTLVTAGYRTWREQIEEYRKGRAMTAGGWVVVDERAVTTRALPGRAPHCRRAAYDLWLLFGKDGQGHWRRATMDPKDGWTSAEIERQTILWAALVRIGTDLGMVCGANWPKLKDWPHFERPDWRELPAPEEEPHVADVS
jgi:hypothetical protein